MRAFNLPNGENPTTRSDMRAFNLPNGTPTATTKRKRPTQTRCHTRKWLTPKVPGVEVSRTGDPVPS